MSTPIMMKQLTNHHIHPNQTFTGIYSWGSSWKYFIIGLGNDLLPVRHQAIFWASDAIVHRCIYASLCLNVLIVILQVMRAGAKFHMPAASFTLTLERRPLYYLLNIIIPSLVLAALSALSFAVPVDSGEKLTLSMSILVAFSVFMLILQENTPEADSPLLGKYRVCGQGAAMVNNFISYCLENFHKDHDTGRREARCSLWNQAQGCY